MDGAVRINITGLGLHGYNYPVALPRTDVVCKELNCLRKHLLQIREDVLREDIKNRMDKEYPYEQTLQNSGVKKEDKK